LKTFLLADDDWDDKEVFVEALGEIDPSIVCHCAADGQEMIDKLSDGEISDPEIIFLDINMPGMNGWECLVYLKKSELFRDIPVIMYSTSSHRREKELAREFGATGFFTKPSVFSELKNILAGLVAKKPGDIGGIGAYLESL
jgi:CheY-like chemotaxis protein